MGLQAAFRVPIQMHCAHCGSTDVLCDAFAEWDVDSQQWVLSSTYDKGAHCTACDGETRIESRPYDNQEDSRND